MPSSIKIPNPYTGNCKKFLVKLLRCKDVALKVQKQGRAARLATRLPCYENKVEKKGTKTTLHTNKIACQKVTVMHVWCHSSPVIACIQQQPRKRRSLIAWHSLHIQNVHIHPIVLELCMKKEKKA